jgi:hypothetical protein
MRQRPEPAQPEAPWEQGGSSHQSARQTPLGNDSLTDRFKVYIQICGGTEFEQPQTLQEHPKDQTHNLEPHLHQWDMYDPVAHKEAMGR